MRKFIVSLFASSCAMLFADVTISRTSPPEIVIGKEPSQVVTFAANELAYFLGKSLNTNILQKEASTAPVKIFLGVRPDGTQEDNKTWESHIEIRDNGSIFIYGYDNPKWSEANPSPGKLLFSVTYKGTLEATYQFIEDYIGARWIEPGKAGEFIPKHNEITLPAVTRTISPTFTERRLHYLNVLSYQSHTKYMDENEYGMTNDYMLWGLRLRYTSNAARITGCHTPHAMHFEQLLFPKRPELFALQPDGTRTYKDMCWSSQATKDFWWELVDAYFSDKPNPLTGTKSWPGWMRDEFMIDPHDYGKQYFCQCPKCKEIVEKYGENGFGECVFQCIVDVARRTEAKYPDKFITTLVYPPKKMYPESVELPKNLRVRMTVDKFAICSQSDAADKELALMKRWREEQGSKLRLWMYIMSDHGHWLYGVPEFASTNFVKFLRKAAPYSEGIFYEHIEPTHTVRNLDMYLIAHALFDVNFDLDKYRAEYFRIAFGAASEEMQAFYDRIENNWDRIMAAWYKLPPELKSFNEQLKMRKHIFNNYYIYDEIEALQKMIDAAKTKVKGGTPEYRRITLYDKYILAIAKQEFPLHSDDKAHVFRQRPLLFSTIITDEPSEADWDAAPWQEMVNAHKGNPVNVKSRFKILSSDTTFYFHADYEEPFIAQSRTKDDGNKLANIWDDNETELFFASEKTGEIIQIGINDKGVAVIHDQATHKFRMAGDEIKVRVARGKKSWTVTAAIPNALTGFSPMASEDAFNVTRTRNVAKLKDEYYTYIPECIYGRWHMPMLYPIVKPMPRNPIKPEFKNGALPPSDTPMETLVEDAVVVGKNWSTWVTPPGRSTFARDDSIKHGKGKSYMIDSSKEVPKAKDNPGLWQYTHKCPPKGTRIRATAWVLVSTSLPDAAISMSINWRNANNRWITGKDLCGVSSTPIKVGEWSQVSMEMVVPDNDDISFFTVLIHGIHTCPGKVWIGELKLETAK